MLLPQKCQVFLCFTAGAIYFGTLDKAAQSQSSSTRHYHLQWWCVLPPSPARQQCLLCSDEGILQIMGCIIPGVFQEADPPRHRHPHWLVGTWELQPIQQSDNQSVSLNCVIKNLQHWKEAPIDCMLLALYQLQAYYVNEIKQGIARVGEYHLLPMHNSRSAHCTLHPNSFPWSCGQH